MDSGQHNALPPNVPDAVLNELQRLQTTVTRLSPVMEAEDCFRLRCDLALTWVCLERIETRAAHRVRIQAQRLGLL